MTISQSGQPIKEDGSKLLYLQAHDPNSEFGSVVKNWLNTGPRWFSILMLNPQVKAAIYGVSSAGNEIEIWSLTNPNGLPWLDIAVNGINASGDRTSISKTFRDEDLEESNGAVRKITEAIRELNAAVLSESSIGQKAQAINKAIEREKASIILSVMPEGKIVDRMPFHPFFDLFINNDGIKMASTRAAQNGIQIDLLSYDAGEYVLRGLKGLESHELHFSHVRDIAPLIQGYIHDIVDFMMKK